MQSFPGGILGRLSFSCSARHIEGQRSEGRGSPIALSFLGGYGREKEMATHSSVLVWRIPGTREPGGLPSMGSHSVGHD